MVKPSVTYSPTSNPTSGQAHDARARAWSFVFDCHANKNAAGMTSTGDDDAKGSQHDRAKTSISETN